MGILPIMFLCIVFFTLGDLIGQYVKKQQCKKLLISWFSKMCDDCTCKNGKEKPDIGRHD